MPVENIRDIKVLVDEARENAKFLREITTNDLSSDGIDVEKLEDYVKKCLYEDRPTITDDMDVSELYENVAMENAENTLNAYMTAMHIKTDLVDEGYIFNKNLTRNERNE